jgi:hypothetical protein
MLPTLNRSAVIVTARQPFLEWLHGADPTSLTLTLEDMKEPTIYLLPDCEDDQDLVTHLRNYCETIFKSELESWYADPSTWPVDRDFRTFCRWFEYRTHTLVLDLCDGGLRRY